MADTTELNELKSGMVLRHAGVVQRDDPNPTVRIKLWCDDAPTEHYLGWLDSQCDKQRISGIKGVLAVAPHDSDGSYRLLLIVDKDVDTDNAVGLWLHGVNKAIGQLEVEEVSKLTDQVPEATAVSARSSSGTETHSRDY